MVEKLWTMGMQGTVLIGVVFVLRQLMRRYPKKYSYMLWLLVLVRLLCPVFIESGTSLQPDLWQLAKNLQGGRGAGDMEGIGEPIRLVGLAGLENRLDGSIGTLPASGMLRPSGGIGSASRPQVWPGTDDAGKPFFVGQGTRMGCQEVSPDGIRAGQTDPDTKKNSINILKMVYLSGLAVVASCFIIQYILFKKRTITAVRAGEGIWQCGQVCSPFVLGLFRPKIFLPYGIPEGELGYILRHERMHIRHKDPFLRLFGMAAACLHWWNPTVWYAVHKMSQDMEMYCDEAVLAGAGPEEKKGYSTALLHFSMRQSGLEAALAFGESNTEKRVKNIMKTKKKNMVIAGGFFAVAAACAALFLTVPEAGGETDNTFGQADVTQAPADGMDPVPNDTGKDSVWKQIGDFALALPDGDGLVESKLVPDRMGPYSVLYFVDDTHFIVMAGELYYTTEAAVESRREEWEQEAARYEEEGEEYPLVRRPQAGVCAVYDWKGYPKEIYKPMEEEKAWKKAEEYDSHIAFMEEAEEYRQRDWERLADFALPVMDENGLVESKLVPDQMLPGSKIYYMDDTHFIILSGGLYYDTQEKVDQAKERWAQAILNGEGRETVLEATPHYAAAGNYVDYLADGSAHRIYDNKTMEESLQRGLWDSKNIEVLLHRQEDVPWNQLTDLAGITLWFLDEGDNQYEISYQYDLADAGYFEGKVLMADANFDGQEDILIDLGKYGNQGIQYYTCFLWSQEQQNYVWIPEFEQIPNPALNPDTKQIISGSRDTAAGYFYERYAWEGMSPVVQEGLYVSYSGEDAVNPHEISKWENGEKVSAGSGGQALYQAWQQDIKLLNGPLAGRLVYSEEMRRFEAGTPEGIWQITNCVGAAKISALSVGEQHEIIGKKIAYRNKLHRQYAVDGTEYFLSLQPDLGDNGWAVAYGNADQAVFVEGFVQEQLSREEFIEKWKMSPDSLGLPEGPITECQMVDGYGGNFGTCCFMVDGRTMLVVYEGAFFLAKKE